MNVTQRLPLSKQEVLLLVLLLGRNLRLLLPVFLFIISVV